jgi:hypothetical protein
MDIITVRACDTLFHIERTKLIQSEFFKRLLDFQDTCMLEDIHREVIVDLEPDIFTYIVDHMKFGSLYVDYSDHVLFDKLLKMSDYIQYPLCASITVPTLTITVVGKVPLYFRDPVPPPIIDSIEVTPPVFKRCTYCKHIEGFVIHPFDGSTDVPLHMSRLIHDINQFRIMYLKTMSIQRVIYRIVEQQNWNYAYKFRLHIQFVNDSMESVPCIGQLRNASLDDNWDEVVCTSNIRVIDTIRDQIWYQ